MSNNNVCESCRKKGNEYLYPRRKEIGFFKSWFKSPDEWVCGECLIREIGVGDE
ncbi:hypothetical protein K8R33_02800 [archaeon]|nr:hypothetical protein [archaeon]